MEQQSVHSGVHIGALVVGAVVAVAGSPWWTAVAQERVQGGDTAVVQNELELAVPAEDDVHGRSDGVETLAETTSATATTASTSGFFTAPARELATTTAPTRAPVLPDEEQVPVDVFKDRAVEQFTLTNAFAFFVQSAARNGVPTETIALVLLLPFLMSLVAFVRNIIGLPTMDMLVPASFAIALVASNALVGMVLLVTIVVFSIAARIILKSVRIMQLPKIALSMFVVALGVLGVLYVSSFFDLLSVEEISIVPILLLILLSERVVRLPFENALGRTLAIVLTTLALGALGYALFSAQTVRVAILLYPEFMLLLIPFNILVGRYFGLRLTEYLRFGGLDEQA